MRKQSFIIEACRMPGTVVGCHLLCLGSCLARGVVLQLFVQTYHRLLSAFWHFYNQCLFNSFRQVISFECESKVSFWQSWAGHKLKKRPHPFFSSNVLLSTARLISPNLAFVKNLVVFSSMTGIQDHAQLD
jgi:hypothetical protein